MVRGESMSGKDEETRIKALALQLLFFEVGTLSGGLVSSAPE
jgi:hypothetical protein